MLYHVHAVGQFHFGNARFVNDKDCFFLVLAVFIAACGFQVNLKFCTNFGCFDLGLAVVGVFYKGNGAFDNILIHVDILGVEFHGVVAGICVHVILGRVKQVTRRRRNFLQVIVTAVARVIIGQKVAVLIRGVGVKQYAVLIHAVHRTLKGCVALGFSVWPAVFGDEHIGVNRKGHRDKSAFFFITEVNIRIHLEYVGSPFLQDVLNGCARDLVPLNVNILCFGEHVTHSHVFLGQHITRADQNIVKHRNTRMVGLGGKIDGFARKRSTLQAESNALHKAVLRGLCNLNTTSFEFVIKGFLGHFLPFDNGGLCVGNDIFFLDVYFLQGIGGVTRDEHIFKDGNTIFIGHGKLLHRMPRKRCAGELKLYALHHIVLAGLNHFQFATLQGVIERDGCGLPADNGNGANLLRLVVVDIFLGHGVGAGFQVGNRDLTAVCGGNGLIHAVARKGEGNTVHHTVLACLYDLAVAGDNFIYRIDGNGSVGSIFVECFRPGCRSVGSVVSRENTLNDFILAVRDRHFGLRIARAVGRADAVLLSRGGFGGNEHRTCKCLAVSILFVNLNTAVILPILYGKMIVGVGIAGLVTGLPHPIDTGDFGATVVAHVDDIVHAFISAGVNGNMGMGVFFRTEDNQVTGGQLATIHVGCACTDFLDFALVHKTVQCFLPSDDGLGVPTRCGNGIADKACVNTLDIREVVADKVGHERSTAQTLALKGRNVGCSTRYGAAVGNVLFTGGACSVRNIRKNVARCSGAVTVRLIQRSVVLLRLYVISRVFQGTENVAVSHIVGQVGCNRRKRTHRHCHNHHYNGKQSRQKL